MKDAPSIDDCLRALPEILTELREVRRENAELKLLVRANQNGLTRPLYDIDQLMELGISRDQGYQILRTHGKRVGGRYRITQEQLTRYYTNTAN